MAVRPTTFADFNGQADIIENLTFSVRSALRRQQPLGHTLFTGPAGLGKTTLAASVLPAELQCSVQSINCAAIEKPQDLMLVLARAEGGSILFLDELHALPVAAREHLLTAMEDQVLYVKLDADETAEVRLPLFTVIGATTREGLLDGPLRSRFVNTFTLQPYTIREITEIAVWHLKGHPVQSVTTDALALLAQASQGVARKAVGLIESCIDTHFGAEGCSDDFVTFNDTLVKNTLDRLGYRGAIEPRQARYMKYLYQQSKPVGLRTLAQALNETVQTVEEAYEPWLVAQGLITKESRGRQLTTAGRRAWERQR